MKEIPLTQGMVAWVDDDWYDYLMQWKWYYWKDSRHNTGYAMRNEGKWPHRTMVRMHRVIMGTPDNMEVNHIDFNGINNQTYNLENVTHAENVQHKSVYKNNTSGFTGVYKNGNNWQALIGADGQRTYLGTFNAKEDAARVYDAAAIKHFGKQAILNFPEEHLFH